MPRCASSNGPRSQSGLNQCLRPWTMVTDWSDGLGLPNSAREEKKSNVMGLVRFGVLSRHRGPKKWYSSIKIIIALQDFIFSLPFENRNIIHPK